MKKTALRVKTAIRGGKLAANHSRPSLKVRTGIKSGGQDLNHSRNLL
jgi:hypothetical protein